MTNRNLLARLVTRGDTVEIKDGRLCIQSASGKKVPQSWYNKNFVMLTDQILEATNQPALRYLGFSVTDFKNEGYVTLQFETCWHHQSRYILYNCLRTRQRDTKHGRKGSKLPRGHFSVLQRSDLAKLFRALPFKTPKLSSLHEYMGNLKGLLFVGQTEKPDSERLTKKSFKPLNISAETIRAAIIQPTSATDTRLTTDRQVADNPPTSSPTSNPSQPNNHEAYSHSQPHSFYHRKTDNRDTVKLANVFPFPSNLGRGSAPAPEQNSDQWQSEYEAGPNYDSGNFPNDFG